MQSFQRRSKELLPTGPAAGEFERVSQIYHECSFPCCRNQLVAALHNTRGTRRNFREKIEAALAAAFRTPKESAECAIQKTIALF
jgi:hypothetical protein